MPSHMIRRAALYGTAIALCLGAAPAFAADAPAPAADAADNTIRNTDDIIVTGTKVNQATPITASVHTFEPQAIVSRSIIENSIAPTADYSQVILLTPSASLLPSSGNGVGLGDAKIVLRGFKDGQYNMTIDGVPFGDTNDPTHHSTSYFPNGTYDRIIVDRGPGGATDLGQASYGGQVHLISREVENKFFVENQSVYGSFDTWMERLTVNSGEIKALGGLKLMGVGEYKTTNGALTHESADWTNLFGKAELPIGNNAKFTFVAAYNHSPFHQSDAGGGATQAQINMFGQNFGGVDPSQAAGSGYTNARTDWNWEIKTTDFEIARLQWNVASNIAIDNKAYTYFYKNFTISTTDSTDPCNILSTATQCSGSAYKNAKAQGTGLEGSGGATLKGDIPGYSKLNQYRVLGDILQTTWTNSLGILKVGAWYEHAETKRYRYFYDFTSASAAGGLGDEYFNASIMNNGSNWSWDQKTSTGFVEANGTPLPAYLNFDEHSGWNQIQFFGEMAFKLLDDKLTLTPGVKSMVFTRFIDTPIAAQSSRHSLYDHQNYKPTLPYATINYLIQPNLSIYGQFAKGFVIPSLSNSLESSGANNALVPVVPVPTKTTNWQTGMVYAGNRINVDVDGYYILASNSTAVDPTNPNVQVLNANPARYEGLEGQISYVILPHLTALANATIMSSKDETTHLWLPSSPTNTETLGLLYNNGIFNFSFIEKFTGRQYADSANQVPVAAYDYGILSASAKWKNYTLGLSVTNVFNNQPVTSIGGSTALPLYIFQTRRSFQASFKARF
ncbi:TonB-dependent receptor [Novosphingobium sp. Fuku2-ISO-50]|uniref:TonB-dependent receptor n=1 Tax=Novosphingobium sp. Fuku2-ISO-50 TaxID=1739114 RepID=UPI000B0F7E55|nr:TonB-dependent receptor [Novosphingobium sp. Fuku2-ISO-50]